MTSDPGSGRSQGFGRLIPALLRVPQYPTRVHPWGRLPRTPRRSKGSARSRVVAERHAHPHPGPRPEKARPGRSPAASAMRTQIPHLMHLPASKLSPERGGDELDAAGVGCRVVAGVRTELVGETAQPAGSFPRRQSQSRHRSASATTGSRVSLERRAALPAARSASRARSSTDSTRPVRVEAPGLGPAGGAARQERGDRPRGLPPVRDCLHREPGRLLERRRCRSTKTPGGSPEPVSSARRLPGSPLPARARRVRSRFPRSRRPVDGAPVRISTPSRAARATSASSASAGAGIAPPARPPRSNTTHRWPSRARKYAAERPGGPAPTRRRACPSRAGPEG